MSNNNPLDVNEKEIQEIHKGLLERYGEPEDPWDLTGIEYLVETILSQNTNDVNRDKAFENLQEKYSEDWGAVENAPHEELTETIRVAGLGPTKAERIQEALKIIRESERSDEQYSIEFLDEMSVEGAKEWLTEIPGIGPKTAAVILCFHFRKPVIPVDTHVHRISQRFQLVPEGVSRTRTHEILEEIVPNEIKYSFHILLITHGRETCKARNHVDNENCFDRCIHYQKVVKGNEDPGEVV
ncbi:MAG: endonuclease III [Candidatus Nanosalina sp.]